MKFYPTYNISSTSYIWRNSLCKKYMKLIPIFMLVFLYLYLCWSIYVGKERTTNINVRLSWRKEDYYSLVWLWIIAKKYISIMVTYHKFIEYGIFGSNFRHSMLDFLNENSIEKYNDNPYIISNNNVTIFGHLQQLSHFCLK